MKARIVIGANYGDEGKGTVVANYTKQSENVLNILTNGGAQRGHSILTKDGNITYHHFGSGTYYGADNYYSRFFILNPMQFVQEYESLIIKPEHIYRDANCFWSTPYDSMANLITETLQKRKASCGMGIFNTIKRTIAHGMPFDLFIDVNSEYKYKYLNRIKLYYEKQITIPDSFKEIWNSPVMQKHFINDCYFMYHHTERIRLSDLNYENLIFENGQGLLLSDTGKNTYDTTPSKTGIEYSKLLLKHLNPEDVTVHYVTRPYLTRHGDGYLMNECESNYQDRTNTYNDFQGKFRIGTLDIASLKNRILEDAGDVNFEIELTHCDEMDRVSEFKQYFDKVNIYDKALI